MALLHVGKVPACLKEQVVSVNGTYLAYADQPEGPTFGWCDSTPPTCEKPQCGVTVPKFWTALVGSSSHRKHSSQQQPQ